MENTTLTSNNLTTDKSFNGTIWRPINSNLNDELVFEVAQISFDLKEIKVFQQGYFFLHLDNIQLFFLFVNFFQLLR